MSPDALSPDPITVLAKKAFGISYLYPYQRLVIANVIDALQDPGEEGPLRQVVLLPTGSGKSLCFQLPSLLMKGLTIVVYPLLGLIADQHRRLEERNIKAVCMRGGMTPAEKEAAFSACFSGDTRMVLANPEILCTPDCLDFLGKAKIDHFVVDEAHCITEWGDSFRPSYLELGRPLAAAKPRVVTAFTATASPPILNRITSLLFGREPYGLIAGQPDRPNIHYSVIPTISMLRSIRKAAFQSVKPLIVFVQSRKTAELVAEDLRQCFPEIDARFYHAGLEKTERSELERWFLHSADGVLCATCAYGMGLDKPDVHTVIHYGPPSSTEAYLQESGRAGRDGQDAEAILIAMDRSGRDSIPDTNQPMSELGIVAAARKKLMESYAAGGGGCRREYLLAAMGDPGAPETSCSGCDRCRNMDQKTAEGQEQILAAIQKHPGRLTERGMAQFLGGEPGQGLHPGWGTLGHWNPDEIDEAVASLISQSMILRKRRGPWKGRLGPRARDRPSQSGKSSASGDPASSARTGGASFLRIFGGRADLDQGSAM
ncbi:MAG: RecQ family ATP-dependent DNA helicase [Spirochaetia bacterium]|jgi:ATP-dependent DNA helicase RecQ|nr:RecQ family ATP-dependent DNA helicase [Spirochaetia bacterium]